MAIFEIGNGEITASVDSHGAELRSLRSAGNGMEYMWRGIRHTGGGHPRFFFHLSGC